MRKSSCRSPIRRSLAIVLASLAMVALSIPLGPPPVEAVSGYRCFNSFDFTNSRRRVYGAIGVECGGGVHDAPFGNWGVDSTYGSRSDTDQFAGWWPRNSRGRKKQWNSCTVNHREWRAPNYDYYNDPATGFRTQKADPDNARSYATTSWKGPANTTCEDQFADVYTFRNTYMGLFELDGWFGWRWLNDDDFVANLSYGTINIPLRCERAWRCGGRSDWIAPTGDNGKASADIQVNLRMWRTR